MSKILKLLTRRGYLHSSDTISWVLYFNDDKPEKVEGLRVQHEYKITVVAIGTIGESQHSNAAIIYVPGVELNTTRSSSRNSRPESAK